MHNFFKSKKKIKIAIITNIPTPYRKKQWEYYSDCEYFDITVFYCAHSEKGRYWKINSSEGVKEIFLKGLTFKSFHFNLGILKIVFQDFDIFFVGGYGYPSVIMSIFALNILRKPWVMIIDGISPLKLKKGNFIVEKIKEMLIKGADAYFANGTVGAEYLKKYGIPSEKIFNQYMTVDVNCFMEKGSDSVKFRNEIRQKYNINEDSIVFMYAGRLIEQKGVQDLIAAVNNLNNMNIKTLIVGDGSFKDELKKQSDGILSDVVFTGHVNPEVLYKYYYASDIFVLPTYDDPWGLVVNEAMSCGLPIIITNAAGCYLDLVKNNGFIVTPGDINMFSGAIENLMEKNLRKEFGSRSRRRILNWTYKNSSESLMELIKFINE